MWSSTEIRQIILHAFIRVAVLSSRRMAVRVVVSQNRMINRKPALRSSLVLDLLYVLLRQLTLNPYHSLIQGSAKARLLYREESQGCSSNLASQLGNEVFAMAWTECSSGENGGPLAVSRQCVVWSEIIGASHHRPEIPR